MANYSTSSNSRETKALTWERDLARANSRRADSARGRTLEDLARSIPLEDPLREGSLVKALAKTQVDMPFLQSRGAVSSLRSWVHKACSTRWAELRTCFRHSTHSGQQSNSWSEIASSTSQESLATRHKQAGYFRCSKIWLLWMHWLLWLSWMLTRVKEEAWAWARGTRAEWMKEAKAGTNQGEELLGASRTGTKARPRPRGSKVSYWANSSYFSSSRDVTSNDRPETSSLSIWRRH